METPSPTTRPRTAGGGETQEAAAAAKRRKFDFSKSPLFTAIFCDASADALAQQAIAARWAGADAVCIEMKNLPRGDRTPEALRRIVDATPLPAMFCLYRSDCLKQDDETRQRDLFAAIEAGAACVDVMGDLFEPSPREWARGAEAVARQRALVGKIHAAGAQAVISAHILQFAPPESVLEQLRDFERRGADVVKLVQTADTEEEFLDALRTTMLCRRELRTPFVHLVSGAFGDLHRALAPSLGIALTFATLDKRGAFPMPQPPLANLKAVREALRPFLPSA